MSLFEGPEQHAANPPESWIVKGGGRYWTLCTKDGTVLESATRKYAAEALRTDSFSRRLYDTEARWYAGEQITGWRPWAELVAEREAAKARLVEAFS